ncbi:MAG: energy transducer TonB [Nibricoccus sp.]
MGDFQSEVGARGGAEASPRLLAVAPVTVEKEKSGSLKLPLSVGAKVSLDETAKVTKVVFDQAEMERFRPEVEASLGQWRFAPARREGVAVSSDISVPFMIWGPEKAVPKVKTPPQVKKRERPNYPRELLKQNISGEVLVSFVIDEKGNVTDAKAVRSTHPEFEASAVECVRKWTFTPALEDGKPVKTRMQMPILFNLNTR